MERGGRELQEDLAQGVRLKIVEREVAGAAAWFLEELRHGLALAALLRAHMETTPGRFTVLLPEGVPGDDRFRTGGKFPSGTSFPVAVAKGSADGELSRLFATLPGAATYAFEDWNMRPNDRERPWAADRRLGLLGEAVFHVTNVREAEMIERCIRHANATWYGLGIASSASRPAWQSHRHEWTEDEARELVAGTLCAAFSVYDAESHILWRPG